VQPSQFAGHAGDPDDPRGVLLRVNGLLMELVIDRATPIGWPILRGVGPAARGGSRTIMDCEDSVAT
jgi:malate synthase